MVSTLLRLEPIFSGGCFGIDKLFWYVIVGIRAFGISIPASLLMLLRIKCYVNSLFNPSCVPVSVTVNKLNLAPRVDNVPSH